MASLDPLARREFMKTMVEAVAETGLTVLLSSHVVTELERVCDHLVLLHQGRVRLARRHRRPARRAPAAHRPAQRRHRGRRRAHRGDPRHPAQPPDPARPSSMDGDRTGLRAGAMMCRMTWEALLSAAIGAVIALSGTLLADLRRDRRQRERDHDIERRKYCVEFTLALNAALGGLREAARVPADERVEAATRAVATSGVYGAREQLLLAGTPALLTAGEAVFHRLIEVRDAVRGGASLDSPAYHEAYHGFADALWRFRLAVRGDLGQPGLTPAALDRPDWSDRDRCTVCGVLTAAA
ncbi:hypothetical protein [Catellatospora sp. NPDC049133]|uniref:hypothetical protein n=1 Tax=Catellatospora sp. NPDC049133 TaxID=3155499 RepID=UPI00340910FA